MTHRRPALAIATLALAALAITGPVRRAGAEDPKPGTKDVVASAKVLHPGSRFTLTGGLENDRERVVAAVGVVEHDGKFGELAMLGRGTVERDPDGVRRGHVSVDLARRTPLGRLHTTMLAGLRLPPLGLVRDLDGARRLAGPLLALDVVAPQNLAVTALEAVGKPTVGEALKVRWTITRTTPGPVGPAHWAAVTSPGDVRRDRPDDYESSPLEIPENGTKTGKSEFARLDRAGPHTVWCLVEYDGNVDSPRDDDVRRIVVDVAPAPGSAPMPDPSTGPSTTPAPPPVPPPAPPRHGPRPVPAPPPVPPPAPPPTAPSAPPAPQPLPNLVPKIPDVLSGPFEPGAVVPVPYEVTNRGAAAARATTVALLLVTARGTRLLDEEPLPALAAGATKRGRLRAELPADLAGGRVRLRVVVDRGHAVGETDESDDATDVEVEVVASPGNLVVASVSAEPAAAPAGTDVRLVAVVRNTGRGATPSCVLAFSAMLARSRDTLDLGHADIAALAAGAEARVERTARIPEDAKPARWALMATADSSKFVEESDENDNVAVVPGGLTVEEAAGPDVDLKVRDVTIDVAPDAGPSDPVRVRVRVGNAGRSVAPAFDVSLLLTTRERPERRRDGWKGIVSEVARVTFPAGVAGGTEAVREAEGRLPAGIAPGAYFVLAVPDPSGAVAERKGDDDLASAPLRVAGRAVLHVADRVLSLAPAEAPPGGEFAVTTVVRNDGNQASAPGSADLVWVGERAGPRGRRASSPDLALASVPLPALRPGEAHKVSIRAAVAPTTPRGRYRVALRVGAPGAEGVDVPGVVGVTSPARGFDLTAYDGRVDPARVRAGAAVRVVARVANVGDARSPATTVRVDVVDGPIATPVGGADVPLLAPGQTVDVTVAARVPRGTDPGVAWFVLRVDPQSAVADVARENNETWMSVTVEGRFDRDVRLGLGAAARAGSGTAMPGGPLDVRARVENLGDEAVDGADVEAVLVSRSGATRSLGRRAVAGSVEHGGAVDWAERFVLPEDLEPGAYVVRLLLDPDRRLPWAPGEDARAVAEFPVDVAASATACDLAAVSLENTARVRTPPRHVVVSAMILNRGPGKAPTFNASLYLASVDGSGLWLPLMTRVVPGDFVGPGVETRAQFDVEVPEEIPEGDYRAVVVVDDEARVDTSHRGDNQASVDVHVGAASVPPTPIPVLPPPSGADVDLVIVDLQPPAQPTKPEHTAELRYRVTAHKASERTKAFRWVVSVRGADGAYTELMTSPAEAIPSAGSHRTGSFSIPVRKGLAGRVRLRVEARPEGPGDLVPGDNVVETDLVVDGDSEAPAAPSVAGAADASRLPIALPALLPSGTLVREGPTSATLLVSYASDAASATVLEITLEAGGATFPLGEFDVPAGAFGTTAAVKARLRAPSSAAAGPATLVLVVRDDAGTARAALRQAITVR